MTSQTCASTDKRNYGIDLLRMVAMFMVVILHVLGQGGVLAKTAGLKNHIAWLLETGAYCAVDCFAIISGFVSYTDKEKTYRYSKFFRLATSNYLQFWHYINCFSREAGNRRRSKDRDKIFTSCCYKSVLVCKCVCRTLFHYPLAE